MVRTTTRKDSFGAVDDLVVVEEDDGARGVDGENERLERESDGEFSYAREAIKEDN